MKTLSTIPSINGACSNTKHPGAPLDTVPNELQLPPAELTVSMPLAMAWKAPIEIGSWSAGYILIYKMEMKTWERKYLEGRNKNPRFGQLVCFDRSRVNRNIPQLFLFLVDPWAKSNQIFRSFKILIQWINLSQISK